MQSKISLLVCQQQSHCWLAGVLFGGILFVVVLSQNLDCFVQKHFSSLLLLLDLVLEPVLICAYVLTATSLREWLNRPVQHTSRGFGAHCRARPDDSRSLPTPLPDKGGVGGG